MTHICDSKLTVIGSDNGLSLGRRQAIICGQCWDIANWTPRNKLQWNFYRNSYIFIHENPFENVVWKMASILSWPQCVKVVRSTFVIIIPWNGKGVNSNNKNNNSNKIFILVAIDYAIPPWQLPSVKCVYSLNSICRNRSPCTVHRV